MTLYPASISGRKILDQNGHVYLARTFSSWGMFKLTDANITTALEGLAARHFNGVTVWIGGGYRYNTTWLPYYQNNDAENYWTGTAWQSSLGAAWGTVDWIVSECNRLGMVAHLSFGPAYGPTGPKADMVAASNAQMQQVGVDVATRYQSSPNIVWHVMFDDTETPGTTLGARIEALFTGINSVEGTARPVRWCEVNQNSSTNGQGWYNTTNAKMSINCVYSYSNNSVEVVETVYAELGAGLMGDCEPPYDGSGSSPGHYTGNQGQQLRERSYAVFLEGGCLINYGNEAWWQFGLDGPVPTDEGIAWTDVAAHVHTVEQQYVWDLLDLYVADASWAPTSSFVTTGEGTGDTKAAVGASNTAALAYFPNSRTTVVDTTIIAGTGNVRLRWYDPTAGTFSTIAASEAQQSGRSVTFPSNHGDGTSDFVLVVDALDSEATPAVPFRKRMMVRV